MRSCVLYQNVSWTKCGWVLLVSVIAFRTPDVFGQPTIFAEPLSTRVANYNIKVTLDDQAKRIDASAVITWNNPSDDAIDELQFHLYTNAFKNTKSTFMREVLHDEARGRSNSDGIEVPWAKDDGWGWTRITNMEIDGTNATQRIEYYQPDDNNADDETVIRIPLDKPIAPRATARIEIVFESRIPKCQARTGWWADDFFMMAHWFPKIGVYEAPGTRFVPKTSAVGRWNCHQFHGATEFYSDFGMYDVEITLPRKYVVGTTGLITGRRDNGDGTKTIVAHAEDVHEFAWVADAQFREATGVWRDPKTERSVAIRLLYQPDHDDVVNKYIGATKSTLEYVHRWLGANAYPYPNITVVDPRKGSGAGGMEYPNLITGGASWWAETFFGDGVRMTEIVTIHEFMHQIWYGIVGNNEFEEAWLDEGLTTYSENRISAELFGQHTSAIDFWGFQAGSAGLQRAGYARSSGSNDGTIADFTYDHWNTSIGRNMAYNKSSLMLRTLEQYLGRERFDQIMRTYYQRWRFRHPTRLDFVAVANETAPENLDWFFDQLIDQPTSLDYSVASIANVPIEAFDKGLTEHEFRAIEADDTPNEETEDDTDTDEDDEEDKIHQSTVVFRRIGEIVFPMETLIEFSDGEIVRDTWDGRGRIKTYRFTRKGKIVRAVIDPDFKVPLDVNRLNNSRQTEPVDALVNKYTVKGFFWMQSLLQFLSIVG